MSLKKNITVILLTLTSFLGIGAISLFDWLSLLSPNELIADLVLTLSYFVLSICLLYVGYRFVDWLVPHDIEEQIFSHNNVAAAIFKGLFLMSVSIIVAAILVS